MVSDGIVDLARHIYCALIHPHTAHFKGLI